jgi:hypothetical protein
MRMRIISAAVVMGLGLVGITLAQQTGKPTKDQTSAKANLRAQVAKLRAEVELLQLEHEVDRDSLKELMVDLKRVDTLEAGKGPMKAEMEAFLKGPMKQQVEALKNQLESLKTIQKNAGIPDAAAAVPDPEKEINNMLGADEAAARVARPVVERLKKEFTQKATRLNEKRLELAEVEKRYNEAG